MKLINTKLQGPKIIKSIIYKDKRGYLKEVYQKKILKNLDFPFDVMSFSKKNVLRGIHIQTKNPQAKIITVTHGKIFDVAVDLRPKSKSFGKYVSLTISDKDDFSFYIPKGFGHGFLCLSNECTINYKCSNYRDGKSELTINWKDQLININWPVKKPILSFKDNNGMKLEDFSKVIK